MCIRDRREEGRERMDMGDADAVGQSVGEGSSVPASLSTPISAIPHNNTWHAKNAHAHSTE
eukprot:2094042-Rhodomonas_salina.2